MRQAGPAAFHLYQSTLYRVLTYDRSRRNAVPAAAACLLPHSDRAWRGGAPRLRRHAGHSAPHGRQGPNEPGDAVRVHSTHARRGAHRRVDPSTRRRRRAAEGLPRHPVRAGGRCGGGRSPQGSPAPRTRDWAGASPAMKRRGIAERMFNLVLRLYPAEFRDRFGHDMASAYRAARMEAAVRGRKGVAAFWFGVALDALVRAPGEHMMTTMYDLRFAARAL